MMSTAENQYPELFFGSLNLKSWDHMESLFFGMLETRRTWPYLFYTLVKGRFHPRYGISKLTFRCHIPLTHGNGAGASIIQKLL